ncbi:hypothetical protein niasHT_038924 [Heterodera trifolii]|uniref:Transmembrane protein n=1 Tax=Heterodera trifolii TaxID=157864 RepID=A0ABD2IMX3_9BILA
MELFLFRHAEYERLYNCTAFPIDSVPFERRRQFVAGGIAKCVLCAIYYVLYVPCMYSIWKHFHENSCYKLLFYIGITDLGILWILGFFSGWLSLSGAVFCSSPTLMYLVGVAVTALWIAESSADLVLALNRCLEFGFAKLCRLLFFGHRIYAWFFACSLYALGWAVFIKPLLYSSLFFNWFFDPFVGYPTADEQQQREEYEHWLHPVHNSMVAFLSPFIYLVFALKLFYDVRLSTCHLFDAKQNNPHGLPPAVYETVQPTPYRPYWRGYCRPTHFKPIQLNCSTDEFLKIEQNKLKRNSV